MAIIKKKEIKNMAKEELEKRLLELRIELIRVRAQKSSKTAGTKTKEIKRTIARILTRIKQKDLESLKQGEKKK
ncbi:50S ribosomal protein L29 [Candidatus Pacearchaeota archaeon]|nr:50S ribosomal protein L29 [Candidatus Pacearchaeota archaeon]